VLFFGVGNIIIDLGRPDRIANVLKHGRFQSPLLWDVTSISIYLTCSSIYLFVPLIPDMAILRDIVRRGSWRWWLYRTLSLGWTGTKRQHRALDVSISILAVLVIPVAVSVHTVVSFVFSMTIQPMWHSAIFGPYFVAGAIFSGIAALIIAMAVLRKVYKLHDYIKDIHFNYLGLLLFVMTLLWFYFTFAEYLTTFYGNEPVHMTIFWEKLAGRFSWPFWAMVIGCFVIPFIFLCNRRTRTVTGTVIASTTVIIGMWLERFIIVVPTLANPRLPYERGIYFPTWVEWSVTAGCVAAFVFLYVIFAKLFPMVSIWEIKEGREIGLVEAEERLRSYLPHLEPLSAGAVEEGAT
jgi:molybdopterin-containing oxidoreductase family membrane subunit